MTRLIVSCVMGVSVLFVPGALNHTTALRRGKCMSINAVQFRECIVQPVLRYLEPEIPYSKAAEELLMLTAAQESHLGTYLRQVKGPALGVYQVEPNTYRDIHKNFLVFNQGLWQKLKGLLAEHGLGDLDIVGNLHYATALARVHYLRAPASLPSEDNIVGLAAYWKRWYNTPKGKGTVSEAVRNYRHLVLMEGT